jgi:16S rRNA (cytosine1402-N4)-methyltransferase
LKSDEAGAPHRPVLVEEVCGFWHGVEGGFFIDATAGAGGHAAVLLERDSQARYLGLDRDPEAVKTAKERLKDFGKRVTLVNENYANLPEVVSKLGLPPADGLLADFGVSSMQLDQAERGFSFNKPGPLDMRMDPSRGESAAELIGRLSEKDLAAVLERYGEERQARRIARALKEAHSRGELTGTVECAEVVARTIPAAAAKSRIHPATRTFQALRIAVNAELKNIETLLSDAPELLAAGGRAVFISFHSLEDRLVKDAFRDWARACVCPADFPVCRCGGKARFKTLTRKPVEASESEVRENPRSRSAKLRAAEKI